MMVDVPHLFTSSVERRLSLRLLAYWEKARAGRPMPSEEDFKPEDIADLWESCFMVHSDKFSDKSYHYSYLGGNIRQVCASGGDSADWLVSPHTSVVRAVYDEILANQRPVTQEGEFTSSKGSVVRFRRCFLPLGKDGRITAILGGMHLKVF